MSFNDLLLLAILFVGAVWINWSIIKHDLGLSGPRNARHRELNRDAGAGSPPEPTERRHSEVA